MARLVGHGAQGRKAPDFVTLQMMGERGAGKTALAAIAMIILLLEFPDFAGKPSIGWMVSKSHVEQEELDREIADNIPSRWYRYVEEHYRYTFLTGATLTNVSAATEDRTKRGRTDFLLVNECQKMSQRAYLNALARLSDKGGFSLLTGNWPTSRVGAWVYELDEKRKDALNATGTFPIRLVNLKAAGNLTRDQATADQISVIFRALDPRLVATDLDGIQMPLTDKAYWEWDKLRNGSERRPDARPDNIVRDVTAEFTARKTYRRGGYQYVIGCDYQKTPHMAAAVHKLFGFPDSPVLWAIDECLVQGTEEDLIAELLENGYTPENSLIIGDGTGRTQDGAHVAGRTSFQVFQRARYNITGPIPQKDSEHRPANPKFDDRCRLANWAIKNSLYMVDPKGAPTLAEGMAKTELKAGTYGQGRPGGPFRHITDAGTYALLWLHAEKVRKIPAGGSKRLYESITALQVDRYRVS